MPDERPLNVLHVILTLERAGAQEVLRTVAEHARPLGCRTVVATFVDGAAREDLEALGIPVVVLGPRRYGIEALPWFVAEHRRIRRKLASIVHEHAIDVVQTHLLQTLDFLALSLLRVPPVRAVVWTIHNVDFLPRGDRGWARLKRAAHVLLYRARAGRVSGVVAVSDRVRDAIVAEVPGLRDRITTIANGVDPERFRAAADGPALRAELGVPADAELVLTIGRLTEQKGQAVLIEAAQRLAGLHPRAHVLIVGEGELEGDLRALAARAGLADRVHLLGVRVDVARLLASVDVFVLPSLWEGLSVVLLEAMASGTPIVATAVSGTDQVLSDGETGLVVPPGDAGALAASIASVLDDRERARRLGERARGVVTREFGAARQAEAYVALWRSLCA